MKQLITTYYVAIMERNTLSITSTEREEKEPIVMRLRTEDVRRRRQACRPPRNESDALGKVKAIFRALIERPLVTRS